MGIEESPLPVCVGSRWMERTEMNKKGCIFVLTGCTASGKTEWALRWAEQNNAEIVSCDSLLFYRGMDIGTAKPTAEERARVPHHLIDICGVTDRVDVTDYVKNAKLAVEEIAARGRRVLVTGGSGFYLKVFFAPVADDVAVPVGLREEIATRLAQAGLTALVAELEALNPAGLGSLDVANPRRVVRALERCRASGKTMSVLAEDFAKLPSPFGDWDVRCVRLEREPAELERRITVRVESMLAAGLIGEVEQLLAAGLKENPSASRAIGYRETIDFLEGRIPRTALVEEIARNTRALVKKQRTWFRTQLPEYKVVPAAGGLPDGLFVM